MQKLPHHPRLLAASLALWLLACPASAQEPAASPPPPAPSPEAQPAETPAEEEPEDFQFRGLLWNSYSNNFNVPSNGLNQFRGYDFADRKLKLDLLDLDMQYKVDKADNVGFRLELTGGGSMPRVDAAANLFRNEVTGISNTDFDIRQAFLTYKTDFGLRLDAGKFATIFGYEVMPGVDGLNPNATVSWSYTYSPYTHTGLRVTYPVNDQLSLTGLFVTGSDTFTDNNQTPSFGGQIAYKPCDEVQLLVNVMSGPERYNNNVDNRRLIDFIGTFQVHEQVKLGFHTITGIERYSQGVENPYTANWNSLVLYVEDNITDDFGINLRYEWFNDPQGARTGVAQNLKGFTISPHWAVTEDLTLRLDYRLDNSSGAVFDSQGNLVYQQPTIYFNQTLRF